MNILVIGGTRFFGKALVRLLAEKGHDVTIATRGLAEDPFGEQVKRLRIDRENEQSMKDAVDRLSFDVVFDTICYSSEDARIVYSALQGKVKRYIFVSSMAVYNEGFNLKEEDFDAAAYPLRMGTKEDFTYGEGKRQAEAFFSQRADFPVVSVRFPVVLGKDDYTKRLLFYCEKVFRNEPLNAAGGTFSFIDGDEAGHFLAWIAEQSYAGPINANSNGTISLKEILLHLEELTGNRTVLDSKGETAPYNHYVNYTLDNGLARELGFEFGGVKDTVFPLIGHYIEELKQGS